MTELWICPKAGECKNCKPLPRSYRHDKPHKKRESCQIHSVGACEICIPYVEPTVPESEF
jgi:hypothetical protein